MKRRGITVRILNDNEYDLLEKLLSVKQSTLLKIMRRYLADKYDSVISTKDYLYAKGDIPVLLVAHLDTVHKYPVSSLYYDRQKNVLWSPDGLGADDRAGVFSIIQILKAGLRPSVLFTTDEELGCVGARLFSYEHPDPISPLNCIIELDRMGHDDCVFYGCDNPEFTSYIESFGFKTQRGSFSDISDICPMWEIAGVNLSVGYYDEHSFSEHLFVDAMFDTIDKVKQILTDSSQVAYKYIPSKKNFNAKGFVQACQSWTECPPDDFIYDWINYDNEPSVQCEICHSEINEQDATPVYSAEKKQMVHYCLECSSLLPLNLDFCEKCGTLFEKEEADNSSVCPICSK